MKTVIQVGIYCLKCQTSVMKAVTGLTGVNKVEVNVEKHTVTVFGDVDPVVVTKNLRKKTEDGDDTERRTGERRAQEKGRGGKKAAAPIPCCCQKCETMYLSFESGGGCTIT